MAGKKLLVADDSLTIQKVIRLALSNEGYEIQAVSDGNDAVQQISLFRPDVILIDVSLPGKSAFEVKREVNQHEDLSEVRFVLMSSAFEKVDEAQASEVLFHGRLTKPFDPAHLRQVLTDVLAQVEARRTEVTTRIARPAAPASPPSLPTSRFGAPTAPPPAQAAPQVAPPPVPSAPSTDEFESAPQILDLSAHLTPPPAPEAPFPEQETIAAEPETGEREQDDIRQLTESTIKMSGLADDFQWSVNEPSLRPPAKMTDSGNTSFELDLRGGDTPSAFTPEPRPAQEPRQRPAPSPTSSGEVTRKTTRPTGAQSAAPAPAPTPAISPTISKDEMAEVLRSELRKILPEIAERVIKDEIHRMLSEKS
jgi:CheY-like chemotaxis protein